jgi:hypothetical protein
LNRKPRFSEGSNGDCAIELDEKVGKFFAVTIRVHLQSGRHRQKPHLRDSQCKITGEYITALRATPGFKIKTMLLMGYFNMIPGQDISNFHHLKGDDLMDFVSGWDWKDWFPHSLVKGRADLLDRFGGYWRAGQ